MSDTHGPIWIVEDPAKPYPDRRFDGPAIPDGSTPVWASEMGMTPPLDPQQPTPEDMERELHMLRSRVEGWKLRYEAANEVADAARLAADDIALVFRIWPYRTTHSLDSLRALLALMLPDEWYF